jgi:hypothetical protein
VRVDETAELTECDIVETVCNDVMLIVFMELNSLISYSKKAMVDQLLDVSSLIYHWRTMKLTIVPIWMR